MAFLQRRTETESPAFPLDDQDVSIDNVDVVGTDTHPRKLIKDEQVEFYDDGACVYRVGDTVYIESQRSDMPYFICTIREFRRSKVKGNITIDVTWFYRPCEIPQTVYQMLIQDRNLENGSSDHILEDPQVKSKELFISDAIDTYPASALRGRCFSAPFSEIKEYVREFIQQEDHWFYILRYNPESRRMANAKGEIKIGVSHQAILPDYIPMEERSEEDKAELENFCIEELVWDPELGTESKVRFYLCAARSITSFNSYCEVDDGCVEKALNAFSEDQTTADAYDVLHQCNYDVNAALHTLVQDPPTKEEYKMAWVDEDRKKFMRGLRSYGKTFHKIRRELLPDKKTCDLVYYYYLWKKTAIAQNSRPHKRGRRSNVLARKTRASKPKTAAASEFLDLSSCSEHELENSEDSENDRDLRYLYACRHCYTTKSKNWHHAGKNRLLLCLDCRMYFKRYGCMKELRDEERRDPPPFIYKAAFENLDDERLSYTGRMRTRRSSTPIFNTNSSVRNRILLEISEGKHAEALLRKQVLCRELENAKNKDNNMDDGAEDINNPKDVSDTESCDIDDINKTFCSIQDIHEEEDVADVEDNDQQDDAVDADDEEENESEVASPRRVAESCLPDADNLPSPRLSSQPIQEQSEPTHEQHPVADIKEEIEDTVDQEIAPYSSMVDDEAPSSPDVPNDPALDERIKARFKHLATAEDNSCSRCERIFIIKKPKRKKIVDESRHHREESRGHDRSRVITPPISNSAARITSAYESMFRSLLPSVAYGPADPSVASPHGAFWPPGYPLPPELHAHRSTSPHSKSLEQGSKYGHRRMFERHSDAYSASVSLSRASSVAPHPIHPFSPAHTLEPPGRSDLRRPATGHSHISSHLPAAMENLSRISSAGIDRITAERIPGMGSIDRIPPSERVAGADHLGVPPVQPHIHSHLHTHTHLHVHPDDPQVARTYRSHIPQQESHHEHHTTHHDRCAVPAHSSHQSSAAAASYLDPIVRENLTLLSQVQHDPRIRESFLRTAAHAPSHPGHHAHSPHPPHTPHVASHTPHPTHPPHAQHSRETTRSPPVRHESSLHNDPIAYRQWLMQQSAHGHGHSPSLHPSPHGSAPDLSPHGPHFHRSEQEKHLRELKLRAATAAANAANAPEKYLHSAEHEKAREHYRHQMRDVEAKLKGDAQQQSSHFPEHAHAYRPGALHSSYHNNIFMENMSMRRPVHEMPSSSERISHERIMHLDRSREYRDRMSHQERDRMSHQERVVDRSHHDRPSIFGNRKPVTIDLSED